MKSATVSCVVYLLETQFRATQRTVARLQPLVARQRKASGAFWSLRQRTMSFIYSKRQFRATL
ncbi:hypothetical protein [Pilibacter termitis]|uniref:hypothetical protein n=1 Tax=Pilibacter termitis TaxID=263852 RepID=UPI001184A787|nr:hypothetical protein [Pilibacter termitis]